MVSTEGYITTEVSREGYITTEVSREGYLSIELIFLDFHFVITRAGSSDNLNNAR
jgi:hypothetical protein